MFCGNCQLTNKIDLSVCENGLCECSDCLGDGTTPYPDTIYCPLCSEELHICELCGRKVDYSDTSL